MRLPPNLKNIAENWNILSSNAETINLLWKNHFIERSFSSPFVTTNDIVLMCLFFTVWRKRRMLLKLLSSKMCDGYYRYIEVELQLD